MSNTITEPRAADAALAHRPTAVAAARRRRTSASSEHRHQDRRPERHRSRPCRRLSARRRDRRRPQDAQAADRHRRRHPRAASVLDRRRPQPAGRRAVAARALPSPTRTPRCSDSSSPSTASPPSAAPGSRPCRCILAEVNAVDLQRHAALWPVDAARGRGRHPALPHRRRMLPRRRAVRLQGDDLSSRTRTASTPRTRRRSKNADSSRRSRSTR